MGDVVGAAAAAAATGWWAGLGCGGGGSVVLEVTLDRPAAKKIKVRAARGLLSVRWMMRLRGVGRYVRAERNAREV